MIDRFLEPDEDFVIAYDWKGNEIFEGEEVFVIDGEYVRNDLAEIESYFSENFEKISLEKEGYEWWLYRNNLTTRYLLFIGLLNYFMDVLL